MPTRGVPIMVFARAPRPGHTKRRLIPALGADGAAELHRRMLRKVLGTAVQIGPTEVQLWCTPGPDDPTFRALEREFGVSLHVQVGRDLGARMLAGFESALSTHRAAILVGSDCPGLRSSDLEQAIAWLKGDHQAVLGPSHDGGYYLIGLTSPAATVFDGVKWGTGRVLETTRSRLARLGWKWAELEVRVDVDLPADLDRASSAAELR